MKESTIQSTSHRRHNFHKNIDRTKHRIKSARGDIDAYLRVMNGELKYSLPKGYLQWDELTEIFLTSMVCGVDQVKNLKENKQVHRIGMAHLMYMTDKWLSSRSPLFVVTNELIEAFMGSKLFNLDSDFTKELLLDLELIYPDLVLLFPLNCNYLHSKEGKIDFCMVKKAYGYDTINTTDPKDVSFKIKDPVIFLGGVTTESAPFNIGITEEAQTSHNAPSLLLNLRKIVIQCLLLIASKPELVITSDSIKSFSYETSGQGFQKPKYGEKVLYPRVLNLSYAEKKIRSDDNRIQRQGNHSPKSPHWRLGYEVNKPVGKMKGVPREQWERKLIKVAPYFVLGGDDKDNQTTTEA